jgi:hypothetical protein
LEQAPFCLLNLDATMQIHCRETLFAKTTQNNAQKTQNHRKSKEKLLFSIDKSGD